LPFTPLHQHELSNAVRLRVFRGVITAGQREEALREVDAERSAIISDWSRSAGAAMLVAMPGDVTRSLAALDSGDPGAADPLLQLVYAELRQLAAAKRGGGIELLDVDAIELPAPVADDEGVLRIHEALERFAVLDPRKAELVKLRYFVGLNFEDTATALGIAVPTAKQWWAWW
jgi:hypothetical protein